MPTPEASTSGPGETTSSPEQKEAVRVALEELIAAMPHCCSCITAVASILNIDRWHLCEPCWNQVHGPSDQVLVDMRSALALAKAALSEE